MSPMLLLAVPWMWVAGMAFWPLAALAAAFVLVLYPFGILVAPVERRMEWGIGWTPLALLRTPVIAGLAVAGLAAITAPGVALALFVHQVYPAVPYAFPIGSWFGPAWAAAGSVAIGICGCWGALRGFWLGIVRRGTVLALIRDLPTSTARGAAEGLVEMRGVARRIGSANPATVIFPRGRAEPFELEDATGRVRIDPACVPFRAGAWNPFARLFAPGWIEIVLAKPALRDGDAVYVIGTLATRAGLRCVSLARGGWAPGMRGAAPLPVGLWGAASRVFLLSDGHQGTADLRSRVELRVAALLVAGWLIASVWLVISAWPDSRWAADGFPGTLIP